MHRPLAPEIADVFSPPPLSPKAFGLAASDEHSSFQPRSCSPSESLPFLSSASCPGAISTDCRLGSDLASRMVASLTMQNDCFGEVCELRPIHVHTPNALLSPHYKTRDPSHSRQRRDVVAVGSEGLRDLLLLHLENHRERVYRGRTEQLTAQMSAAKISMFPVPASSQRNNCCCFFAADEGASRP